MVFIPAGFYGFFAGYVIYDAKYTFYYFRGKMDEANNYAAKSDVYL